MKKILIVLFGLWLIVGSLFIFKILTTDSDSKEDNKKEKTEEKKLKIINMDSNSRIVAVMINNNHKAWPHAGLDKSFINYEIIAEGGITRIMALYKDMPIDLDKIGSVRSSRPYYLDYVLENDAIYVHWGGSDEAYSDIDALNVDNIDGMDFEGKYFFRDKSHSKIYEHTGFTKSSMIKDAVDYLGYKDTTQKELLFNYSVKEVMLNEMTDSIKADKVIIKYSNYHDTSYVYDENNKVYLRYMSDKSHIDKNTQKQYTAKNIITYKVENVSIDSYGRQELKNIGNGDGYYITNGYATPITWEKKSREEQTIYRYKSTGEEIILNDGNTWIQIQPDNKTLDILSNTNKEIE